MAFFRNVFLSPEINWVFFANGQQSNVRAGQKKTHVFFGNALLKSNARAHLKQRKKHSGLSVTADTSIPAVFNKRIQNMVLFTVGKHCFVGVRLFQESLFYWTLVQTPDFIY